MVNPDASISISPDKRSRFIVPFGLSRTVPLDNKTNSDLQVSAKLNESLLSGL